MKRRILIEDVLEWLDGYCLADDSRSTLEGLIADAPEGYPKHALERLYQDHRMASAAARYIRTTSGVAISTADVESEGNGNGDGI